MNLLPRPRTLELTDVLVENRPPSTRLDPALAAQGYSCTSTPTASSSSGADEAGLFYGTATLAPAGSAARRTPARRARCATTPTSLCAA